MSATRKYPVVCRCRSYKCNLQRFRDKDGSWQPGAIISQPARLKHMERDAQIAARFEEVPDSNSNNEVNYELPTCESERSNGSEKSFNVSELDCEEDLNRLSLSHQCSGPVKLDKSNAFNCSRYDDFSFNHADPAVTHVSLLAVMLSVFDQSSFTTSSWFLKSGKNLLTLAATLGLGESTTKSLNYRQLKTLDTLPSDIRTVIKWMKIDPVLVVVICCRSCFAMYANNSNAPKHCINEIFPSEDEPDHLNKPPGICGEPLFQLGKKDNRPIDRPIKTYAFQSLYDWLGRLFSRPGIETALELSSNLATKPYNPNREASDIQHSIMWKQFLGPDGTQYTNKPENLTFGIFMDGINPYGNRQAGKHASITFIVMVCYSLPLDLRYKPQNVFVVGIAPGPKEPSLEQVNWILRPVVEQLKVLWDPGLVLSQTYLHPEGRRIHAAILPFFADLPALRRGLGFAAPTATRMCSYCLLKKSEITNLQPETWPPRNLEDHKKWAIKSRDAESLKVRKHILLEHGVRYSVMLELPYWNIIDYHVVDSMHNLLLGLFKWHCDRFWCMADIADEDEPKGVPTAELMSLLKDATAPILSAPRPPSPTETATATIEGSGIPFNCMEFRSTESSDDNSFSPYLEAEGWDTGPWTPPSEDKIIFDREALKFINKLLPRIRTPTWIKRVIPILGKASFGRLKADEWRNLFTIQLPLLLPVYWASGGSPARSLFRNFAHLVSMVNLALKRSMTAERVKKYRRHSLEYLKSCLVLFPDVTFAPNHHMSIHLADCLEKFGPSRAWWSFSMERLMGKILKAAHNNRIGQLEITFLTNFCRFGNLQALLSTPDKFPPDLRPYIRQLEAFHDPMPVPEPEVISKKRRSYLDASTLNTLIKRLNELFPSPSGAQWVGSEEWAKKNKSQSLKYLSVTSQIENLSSCVIDNIIYSTYEKNPSNSVVVLRPDCAPQYGVIQKIFTHWRTLADKSSVADTWLLTRPLVPCNFSNPFAGLSNFELQVELKTLQEAPLYINHTKEILINCAWIKYQPSEILPNIKRECIALVSLER